MTPNPMHALSQDLLNKLAAQAEHKVALDIGANEGGFVDLFLQHGMWVHAFEPVPSVYAKLFGKYGNDSRVELNNIGLSDCVGAVLGVTVLEAWTIGRVGDGCLQRSPVDKGTFDMKLTTVDAYLNGAPIGIIKLDADGYEGRILNGARETIAAWRPPILCELSNYIERMSCSAEYFCKTVFGMGYRIVSADGRRQFFSWDQVKPHWPYHSSFDVMLVPNEINI